MTARPTLPKPPKGAHVYTPDCCPAGPEDHTTHHPPGATLYLGGTAWAHPTLRSRLTPIGRTHPYPGNPRRGDQPAITASIRDLGLYAGTITQSSTGYVLVGNHRRAALTALGAEFIPTDPVEVDDTRAAAIVARDNHTSDLGGYDDPELLALLTRDDDLLALSGYDDGGLDALRRAVDNLEFARTAGEVPEGVPVGDLSGPIDLDGDAERVTVVLDPGNREALYALLSDVPYVRDVSNAHVRKPTP